MSADSPWRIPPDAADWECDWRGDQLFHLRYFRALPLAEKIKAVEEMERVAALFAARRLERSFREGAGRRRSAQDSRIR